MMNPLVEAKKAFNNKDWPHVLKVYGCTARELNMDMLQKPMTNMKKRFLEDVGYAYGQLSNFRINRKTKKIENEDIIMTARDNAVKSYEMLLASDEENMKGLQGMAYVYYKFVIDTSGKDIPKMVDLSRVENFKEAKTWYEKILAVDETNMKANYRMGKLYLTLLTDWSPSFKAYMQEQHMSRTQGLNMASVYLHSALTAFQAMKPAQQQQDAKYLVKIKYNLGNAYLHMCWDNGNSLWQTFKANPDQPTPGYTAHIRTQEIDAALRQYLEVLLAYDIDVDGIIDASSLVTGKKKAYIVSPKDVFYRLGYVYTLQYRLQCFTKGRTQADMSLAEKSIYYYLLSLQYAWWMVKKGYNRKENYTYVSQKLDALLGLAGLTLQSETVRQIQDTIPNYIPEPKQHTKY